MRTNLDVWEEDQFIHPDPMDEEYNLMHSKPSGYCDECLEPSWISLNEEFDKSLCDSCLDANFREQINLLVRKDGESIESWVNRHNEISIKSYKQSDVYTYKWCFHCEAPTTWYETFVPVRDIIEGEMSWDVEHEQKDVCERCNEY